MQYLLPVLLLESKQVGDQLELAHMSAFASPHLNQLRFLGAKNRFSSRKLLSGHQFRLRTRSSGDDDLPDPDSGALQQQLLSATRRALLLLIIKIGLQDSADVRFD